MIIYIDSSLSSDRNQHTILQINTIQLLLSRKFHSHRYQIAGRHTKSVFLCKPVHWVLSKPTNLINPADYKGKKASINTHTFRSILS